MTCIFIDLPTKTGTINHRFSPRGLIVNFEIWHRGLFEGAYSRGRGLLKRFVLYMGAYSSTKLLFRCFFRKYLFEINMRSSFYDVLGLFMMVFNHIRVKTYLHFVNFESLLWFLVISLEQDGLLRWTNYLICTASIIFLTLFIISHSRMT